MAVYLFHSFSYWILFSKIYSPDLCLHRLASGEYGLWRGAPKLVSVSFWDPNSRSFHVGFCQWWGDCKREWRNHNNHLSYCIILYLVILHDLNSMAASKGANRLPGRNIAGFLDSLDNIEGSWPKGGGRNNWRLHSQKKEHMMWRAAEYSSFAAHATDYGGRRRSRCPPVFLLKVTEMKASWMSAFCISQSPKSGWTCKLTIESLSKNLCVRGLCLRTFNRCRTTAWHLKIKQAYKNEMQVRSSWKHRLLLRKVLFSVGCDTHGFGPFLEARFGPAIKSTASRHQSFSCFHQAWYPYTLTQSTRESSVSNTVNAQRVVTDQTLARLAMAAHKQKNPNKLDASTIMRMGTFEVAGHRDIICNIPWIPFATKLLERRQSSERFLVRETFTVEQKFSWLCKVLYYLVQFYHIWI